MQVLINFAQSTLDLITAIPMPWRALVLLVIGYGLLYAEFRLTGVFRRIASRPLPGTGMVDFVLKWLIVFSFLGVLWWGAVWAWGYAESAVMASPAAPYIVTARSWWTAANDLVNTWR